MAPWPSSPGANAGSVCALANPDAPAPRRARWNDLGKRTLSAAVMAPVALACLWVGGLPGLALVALAAAGLALEWVKLCGGPPTGLPGISVAGAVLLAVAAATFSSLGALAFLLAAGSLAVWLLTRRQAFAAGVWYIGLGAVALVLLRDDGPAGRANVLFLLLVVWASDIGAYVVGRLLGGPKLAPALSPGKTWSGSVGGLVAAVLAGELAAHWLAPGALGRAGLLAGLLGIASQAGDLLESGIKRRFGVKDSGHLIPGHGGLLDRLDGLLLAAPVAASMAYLTGRGGVLWH